MSTTAPSGTTAVRVIAVVAALTWTGLFLFALWMTTFVQCFTNEHCRLPWGGYALVTAGYAAGLVAGRMLTRRALRLLGQRAIKRRDGIL